MVTCQRCEGKGTTHVLACTFGQGCMFRVVPCFRCEGRGILTEAQLALHAQGEQLREWRRGVTLAQQQQALGQLAGGSA
jgi:hypothetical protein